MANIPSPFAAFDEPMPPITLGVASSGSGPEAHPGRGAARADSGGCQCEPLAQTFCVFEIGLTHSKHLVSSRKSGLGKRMTRRTFAAGNGRTMCPS